MPAPMWRFREKQRAEVHQDPANTEFFTQQDVAERLVQEAAQNTIDATREGGTCLTSRPDDRPDHRRRDDLSGLDLEVIVHVLHRHTTV